MAYEDLEPPDAPASPRPRPWLSWTALVAVGLIVYELTTQPALGAMMLCLKAGWRDVRTARWLRRTDPNRGRGRACFWLYVASGLWKTAVTGVAVFFAVSFLSGLWLTLQVRNRRGGVNQPAPLLPPEVLVTGLLVALVGFGLSALATFAALAIARRNRVRLWLNGAVHQARAEKLWPPLLGDGNRIGRLLLTAGLVTYFLLGPLAIAVGFNALRWAFAFAPGPGFTVLAVVSWYLAVGPGLVLHLHEVKRRVAAARPEQCWGTDPLPDPDAIDPGRWEDDFARRADPTW
jgi:hypothetical protein